MEIDINKYLSEEDKTEIAKEEFKLIVREKVLEEFKNDKRLGSKRMADYERVICNAVFYYLEGEIDKLISQDTKELIKEKVLKAIKNQDYNYSLFRSKSAWDTENSPAQQVVIDTIQEIRPEMKEKLTKKIFENIQLIDIPKISELINELTYEVLKDRLIKQ